MTALKRCLFFISLVAPAVSSADIYMELIEKTRTLDQAGQPRDDLSQTRWVWIGKDRVRNETKDQIIIMRLDQNKLYMVNKTPRNYMTMSLDELGGMLSGMEVSVTETGETKRMNNDKWMTRKYDQVMKTPLGEARAFVWATEDVKVDQPELLENMGMITMTLLQGAQGSSASEKLRAEMRKIKGVPVVTMSSMKMGDETMQAMVSLQAFAEEAAPEGAYDVPAGFAAIEMPGIPAETGQTTEPAAQQQASTQPAATAVAIEVPGHDVPMVEISDEEMGYRLRVPEGYETLRKSKYAHTFTLVLPGGMHEYNVNLVAMGVEDMDEAISTATLAGGKELAETKDIGNGYWVVKAPRATLQEIWVYKNGQTASVHAKCTGPANDLAVLIDMCASLKVTK